MNRKAAQNSCPVCGTQIGWPELSHGGILHGRSTQKGGPFFTIHCPTCRQPLVADEGKGRVYRFRLFDAAPTTPDPFRWFSRLYNFLLGRPAEFEAQPRANAGERGEESARGRSTAPTGRRARLLGELGLEEGVTLEGVKRRYRSLVKELHPDLRPHASNEERREAEQKLIVITGVYREVTRGWTGP